MHRRTLLTGLAAALAAPGVRAQNEPELKVHTDFPSGSARVLGLDPQTRTIRIVPTPHADRGWACWWSAG